MKIFINIHDITHKIFMKILINIHENIHKIFMKILIDNTLENNIHSVRHPESILD